MGEYDTAQICLNGHVVNDSAATRPVHSSPHCATCGAQTIIACPSCQAKIPGRYRFEGYGGMDEFTAPAYCRNCGKAFPWTAEALESARLLADEADLLSPEEREQLKATFPDIVSDTPRTVLAVTRFNRLSAKAGKIIAESLRRLFVDIAAKTAVELIKSQ